MRLLLVGIDPGTDGEHCPAVFRDTDTGDLVLQGWTVADPEPDGLLDEFPLLEPSESLVRLPGRLRPVMLEAVEGHARFAATGRAGEVPDEESAVVVAAHGLQGDLVFRGRPVTASEDLTQIAEHSRIADELVVRVAVRHAQQIREMIVGDQDSALS